MPPPMAVAAEGGELLESGRWPLPTRQDQKPSRRIEVITPTLLWLCAQAKFIAYLDVCVVALSYLTS